MTSKFNVKLSDSKYFRAFWMNRVLWILLCPKHKNFYIYHWERVQKNHPLRGPGDIPNSLSESLYLKKGGRWVKSGLAFSKWWFTFVNGENVSNVHCAESFFSPPVDQKGIWAILQPGDQMEYIATCNCFSISRDAPPKLIHILLQASSSEQCHFMIKCIDTY